MGCGYRDDPLLAVMYVIYACSCTVAGDSWIEVDESLSEQLLPVEVEEDDLSVTGSITSELSSITSSTTNSVNGGSYR
jgi:hypothetical protein